MFRGFSLPTTDDCRLLLFCHTLGDGKFKTYFLFFFMLSMPTGLSAEYANWKEMGG
jgi:hypothetical protein